MQDMSVIWQGQERGYGNFGIASPRNMEKVMLAIREELSESLMPNEIADFSIRNDDTGEILYTGTYNPQLDTCEIYHRKSA